MYSIKFYEDNKLVTQVGGMIPTLPEAIKQIDLFTKGVDATPLQMYVGCRWNKGKNTTCALLISDEWDNFITTK